MVASGSRLSIGALRQACDARGISTLGCVERAELERLLTEAGKPPVEPAPLRQPGMPLGVPARELEEAKAELECWVTYGPRALKLLRWLESCQMTVTLLQQTKLGITVKRYISHPDPSVGACAQTLIQAWKGLLHSTQQRQQLQQQQQQQPQQPKSKRGRRPAPDDDDSSKDGESSSSEDDSSGSDHGDSAGAGASCPQGEHWVESVHTQSYRGSKEKFHVFKLSRPFASVKWLLRVRIAEKQYSQECRELLDRMALEFGAVGSKGDEVCEADRQVLTRLQRLEERFRGNGVTEGEARNAVRLFERELSKANWTEEKFVKLKRQLAGTEEWSAADAVAEASLMWVDGGKRRQAWFSDACERIAVPLGLEFGYCNNGGCCFAGPLSAAAGATLTAALVCHLGDLDLARALASRGRSKISSPQFLQGFVDGALERERHLIWEKLFSIEDGEEAARFAEEHLQSGFFDDLGAAQADEEEGEASEDLHSMLRGLFSAARSSNPRGTTDPPQASAPSSFTPFSGKSRRLEEEDEPPLPKEPQLRKGDAREGTWALAFCTNLEVVRSSKRRSSAEARKSYHWTSSGQAVKPTQTGTDSYSKGRQAGQQRKGEIDGAAGSTTRKFQKRQRLALTG